MNLNNNFLQFCLNLKQSAYRPQFASRFLYNLNLHGKFPDFKISQINPIINFLCSSRLVQSYEQDYFQSLSSFL